MKIREVIKKGSSHFVLMDVGIYEATKDKKIWLDGKGYPEVMVDRKSKKLHQIVYGKLKNPLKVIDHINRNPLDNRRENLRELTHGDNTRNSPTRSNTGHKYIYDTKNKTKKPYMVRVRSYKGKNVYLGHFATIDDAVPVRNKYIEENNIFPAVDSC